MRCGIRTVLIGMTACLLLGTALMGSITRASAADTPSDNFCHNGFAPDGSCRKTEPDDIKASHIITEYCDIAPYREVRGQTLDPRLIDQQAGRARMDTYNDAEKKLLALRRKLLKLNQAAVEEILRGQMVPQDPNDPSNLMCVLEIVARIYPKEYDDYAKLVRAGVDESGFVSYIRDTYLGKSGMHEYPYQT